MPIHGLDAGPHATQSEREFEVYCSLGKDVLLFGEMQGFDRLGHLFQYKLSLLSEQFDLIVNDFLGDSLSFRTGGIELPRYFNGLITRFSITGQIERYARYEVMLHPRAWLLSRASDCRFFNDKSVPQIVKALCANVGMAVEDKLTGSYKSLPYVTQYRETDLDFVTRLMEQEGITFYFRHAKTEHFMVLIDANSAHPCAARSIEYRHDPFLTVQGRDVIHHWSSSGEIQANEFVVNDFDYKRFSASNSKALQVVRQSKPPFKQGRYQKFDYPGGFQDVARGETINRGHLDRLEGQGHEVVAETTVCILHAGMEFELKEHPRPRQNMKYLVTQTTYDIKADLYSTNNTAPNSGGFQYACDITAIDASVAYLPPRTKTKPVVRGPQTAVVIGPAGQEIHTDELGRIKVRFHWERAQGHNRGNDGQPSSFDNGARSCWVRVAQMSAGKAWGSLFTPRIGQEVVVSFLEGDPDRPLVTGSVYNSDNTTALALPRHATRSTIKSNSSLGSGGYNEFRFEDKAGSEQVFTRAHKDHELHVGQDRIDWVGKDCHKIVQAHEVVKIGGDNHWQVAGDKHGQVAGNRVDEIRKTASFTANKMNTRTTLHYSIDAGGNYLVEAKRKAMIKAGDVLTLEAGKMILLKVGGAVVMLTPAGVTVGTQTIISMLPAINPAAASLCMAASTQGMVTGVRAIPVVTKTPTVADDGTK